MAFKPDIKEVAIALCLITVPLIVAVVASLAAGAHSEENQKWKEGLVKPEWMPPEAMFGPVWIVLYFMMGTASFLVYRGARVKDEVIGEEKPSIFKDDKAKFALALYVLHLVLNWTWGPVYFGLHHLLGAFVLVMLMWLTAVGCSVLFWHYSRAATGLFLVVTAWLTFTVVLSGTMWHLNGPGAAPAQPSSTPPPAALIIPVALS